MTIGGDPAYGGHGTGGCGPYCPDCQGGRIVCENHPYLPWETPGGCGCGAGIPCPACCRPIPADGTRPLHSIHDAFGGPFAPGRPASTPRPPADPAAHPAAGAAESAAAAARSLPGVSYRQLDYWVRCGYLRPGRGVGQRRTVPPEEIAVASLMAFLAAAGLHIHTAALVARHLLSIPAPLTPTVTLAPGLTLTYTPGATAPEERPRP